MINGHVGHVVQADSGAACNATASQGLSLSCCATGATDGRSSTEAAVISNAKPSAQELHALMQSVHADLQELGYPAKPCIRKGN